MIQNWKKNSRLASAPLKNVALMKMTRQNVKRKILVDWLMFAIWSLSAENYGGKKIIQITRSLCKVIGKADRFSD